MDVFRALDIAKGSEEKKVGFNLQIPSSRKEEVEEFCKHNGVSMTAFINGLLQTAMEEVKRNPYYQESTLQISEKLENLSWKLSELESSLQYDENGEFINTPKNHATKNEVELLKIVVFALEKELKRRSE
ncbi:MAG: hypothetical protein AB7U44_02495 [Sulfuricurvum sp.]|uniref:hypothetical protein n=1 Tax=Sulfuricurvum sp. TaxID=2025608 RepID=UPI00356B0DE4